MEIRNLGNSGLRVSAVGIGCNNFGQRARRRGHAQGDLQGDRPRHHAVRHRRRLRQSRRLGDRDGRGARRQAQGHRARHQVRHADGRRRRKEGRGAPLHHDGGRGQPEAAEDRSHRSLPAAQLRSADADRGDAARARRSDPPGQGALCRLLEPAGLACRRGATDREERSTRIPSSRSRTSTASWCATSRRTCSRWRRNTSSASCRTSRSPAVF